MTVAAPVCRPASRDHLGSVREVVDADSGTLEARFAYDPWGQPTQVAGTMDVDFAFTGHHYHEKSGFHLAPFREYSAELGRWMSRDPIWEDGGFNLYVYVQNSPYSFIDPKGLALVGIVVTVVVGGFLGLMVLSQTANAMNNTKCNQACSNNLIGTAGAGTWPKYNPIAGSPAFCANAPCRANAERLAGNYRLANAYIEFWNTHCAGPNGNIPCVRGYLGRCY